MAEHLSASMLAVTRGDFIQIFSQAGCLQRCQAQSLQVSKILCVPVPGGPHHMQLELLDCSCSGGARGLQGHLCEADEDGSAHGSPRLPAQISGPQPCAASHRARSLTLRELWVALYALIWSCCRARIDCYCCAKIFWYTMSCPSQ